MDPNSSDSETEAVGYQPVMVERLKPTSNLSPASSSGWPREAVNVYNNGLFKDEEDPVDMQATPPAEPRIPTHKASPAGRSTLAARRAERLQASVYQSNTAPGVPRSVSHPHPPPSHTPVESVSSLAPHGSNGATGSSVYGLQSSYDPEEEQLQRQGLGMTASQRLKPSRSLDVSNVPAFLTQPGPMEGPPIMCYIVRDKGSTKMYPRYCLYLEDPKTFLLAARKRKKQTTSNYIVSLDPEDLNRDSGKFFGKLRANFVGTEFSVFDGGEKGAARGKGATHGAASTSPRQEIAAVTYQYNVLGTRGPRKMMGVIPARDSAGTCLYRATSESDSMLERVKSNRGTDELVVMRNKPPRWNDELNAYCLNFNGRVTEASVKNFQLVTDDNTNHVILQFGKIGKNTFTMDYMWPITALQAFGICLSAFDNKLACE